MILGIVFGIGVSMVNTRLLGPQSYGDLKFLQNLFNFVVIFLTLGVFVSGSRLLALKKNEQIKNQIIGGMVILATIMSAVLILLLFVFSFYEEQLFNNELGRVIRIFSPLLFVFPFQMFLRNVMQGDNRIYELSALRILPKILYLGGAIAFNYFFDLTLISALSIQFFTLILIISILTLRLKPRFNNIKKTISTIWEENKRYGIYDYTGTIVGTASASLGGLTIGYFMNNTNVGFFSLALTITAPLAMIPNAVGTTFFKDFANRNHIPRKASVFTAILSFSALLFLLLVIKQVVILLYSSEYLAVIPLVYIISFGNLFHGFGDYINRFMGAHGQGKFLRNTAIAVGSINIIGYFVLVYFFGIIGASITRLMGGIVYFFVMNYFYRKYKRSIVSSINKII